MMLTFSEHSLENSSSNSSAVSSPLSSFKNALSGPLAIDTSRMVLLGTPNFFSNSMMEWREVL